MTRISALRIVLAAAIAAAPTLVVSPSVARQPIPTGSISGSIRNPPGSTSLDQPFAVDEIRVVASGADGKPQGRLRFLRSAKDDAGSPILLYMIDGVPLGLAVTVTAGPAVAAHPTPIPSGFFMMFQLTPSSGDPGMRAYSVTLDAAHPKATGRDFFYTALEVPPALPQPTPTPMTTPSPFTTRSPFATPSPTPSPASSASASAAPAAITPKSP